ncbi:MAG: hypothetical protein ABW054_09165, partial [Casimicrobiaceae bacterium]
ATNAMDKGSNSMKRFLNARRPKLLEVLRGWAVAVCVAAGGAAAAAPIDESQLLDAGFKVLAATTEVQQKWVRGLPPGAIRPMQRTGKKFFIYPDASRNQVFVGGPKEYEAYVQLHPENRVADAQKQARDASAYRAKQSEAMQKSTARDLSDPWLGVTWADLIY